MHSFLSSAFLGLALSLGAAAQNATCATSSTLTVSKTPSGCNYGNVTAAIAALPNDGQAKIIIIQPGVYNEQISITRNGKVTLRGVTNFVNDYSQNQVTISYNYGVDTSAGQDELTPVVHAKKSDTNGVAMYNINFINTFPQTKNYAALAADYYGASIAAYGCSFIGFQDTLLLNKGVQVISNSYIEGSIDFVWGFSTAFINQCKIATNTPGASISAQSRSTATTVGGYVFNDCYITYTSTYGSTLGLSYLARPYSNFSIAVYTNSYLDANINPAGWSVWQTNNPQTNGVTFAEYNNTGPGSLGQRASFGTKLDAAGAAKYSLASWIGDTSFIDMDQYNLPPSWTVPSTTSPSSSTITSVSSSTSTAVSSITVGGSLTSSTASASVPTSTAIHPASGSIPPAGAVLVSQNSTIAESFDSLSAALASLPSDGSAQTIFIYPGSYVEQFNVNRNGPVTVIGAQAADPGLTYTANKVVVQYARGLSVVAPIPAGHNDAETAVATTTSNQISFYNINFINTLNLDGAIASYVTLAGSTYGDKIAFYGCSFVGWQDTLLTGSTTGYQYYESCYIEGAIDFIWGYSAAYFKGSVIAAKRKSSAMTAQSRAGATSVGGYVFDQCLFTQATDYPTSLAGQVFLGRPYSAFAIVVIKNSYLDAVVNPSGWKIWSATDPRTSNISFVEFNNDGPGNWENNVAARQAFGFATLATEDDYPFTSFMKEGTAWIDLTHYASISTPTAANIDFSSYITMTTPPPGTTTTTATSPATPTVTTGTTDPVAGDFIVSKTPITGTVTYSTVMAAILALPNDKTTQTIFIYPGLYEEQLTLNRSGTTYFRGYSTSPTDYNSNQVTIQSAYGVNTQADESNSDSATLYSRDKQIQMYNINLWNVFGTTHDYASLGFAIGNNGYAAFYDCQIRGNQDTFDLNSGTYAFLYGTYIDGNIDFIWGAGSAYFLNSTIAPNADGSTITAMKRADTVTPGGAVFDQCSVVASPYTTVSDGSVFLGRPYNQFSQVAYVETYLSSIISPAGWEQWSTSSPQTSNVTYVEYNNYGPGAALGQRVNFSHEATNAEIVQFQLANFFAVPGTAWIDFSVVHVQPFVAGTSSPTSTSSTVASSTVVGTATPSSVSTTASPTTTTTTTLVVTSTTVTVSTPTTTSKVSTSTTSVASSTTTPVVVTTITPPASTVYTTEVTSTTIYVYSTPTPKTISEKTTSTITSTSTILPNTKGTTITVTSTITTTSYSTPKVATATTTLTLSPSSTITKISSTTATVKVTVTSYSTKTTTKSTTLTCIPTATPKARRGMDNAYLRRAAKPKAAAAAAAAPALQARALTTLPVSTVTATISSTKSITSTSKLATSTVTVTSVAYKTTETTITASAPSAATSTSTKYATVTVKSVLPSMTVTSTQTTSEKASTVTAKVMVTTTSTDVKKSSTTVTIVKTSTKKGAPVCTAK
ncbi:hypothetical protein MMC25_003518 [Agyrium rufum]|nr:hypothetical protein [Agyrium rufum]